MCIRDSTSTNLEAFLAWFYTLIRCIHQYRWDENQIRDSGTTVTKMFCPCTPAFRVRTYCEMRREYEHGFGHENVRMQRKTVMNYVRSVNLDKKDGREYHVGVKCGPTKF